MNIPHFTLQDFMPVLPTGVLVVGAIVLLLSEVFLSTAQRTYQAVIGTLTAVVAGAVAFSNAFEPGRAVLQGYVVLDPFSSWMTVTVCLGTALAVLLSAGFLKHRNAERGEFYALVLFAAAGMSLLAMSAEFITLFINLEVLSVATYALTSFLRRGPRPAEAGFKYFILGAFSASLLLYGAALLYGATGSTRLADIGAALPTAFVQQPGLVFAGFGLVLVGFAFKVAAVPFHMWSPDAYEGAPSPITAFMSMAPKAAALGAFLRVFGTGFQGLASDWMLPLAYIAGASMVLGNVAALRQKSLKRLLAYSSIAHVGYMLLGVMSGDAQAGAQAVWLYMLTYLLMQSGAFAILIYLQGKGEGERIDDFRGLGRRQPVLAFAMMVFLLSLAGIPPLVGFFSKFILFKLAIEQGHVALTVLALLTSAVAAYYYLNVVAVMYFKEAPEAERAPMGSLATLVVTVSCALILVGTFFGFRLMDWMGRIVLG